MYLPVKSHKVNEVVNEVVVSSVLVHFFKFTSSYIFYIMHVVSLLCLFSSCTLWTTEKASARTEISDGLRLRESKPQRYENNTKSRKHIFYSCLSLAAKGHMWVTPQTMTLDKPLCSLCKYSFTQLKIQEKCRSKIQLGHSADGICSHVVCTLTPQLTCFCIV